MQRKFLHHLAVVAFATFVAGAAQARDVTWSVGIDAAPGVSLGATNARPVYIAPAPVIVAPQPVYIAPRPVYVAPRPVVLVQPEPVYVMPGRHKGWHKHHRHHGHEHDD